MFTRGIIDFKNKNIIYKSFNDYTDEKYFKECINKCFNQQSINNYINTFIENIYKYLCNNQRNKQVILKKYISKDYTNILTNNWNNIFYSFYSYTYFIRRLSHKKFSYAFALTALYEHIFNNLTININEYTQSKYLYAILIGFEGNKKEFTDFCYINLKKIIDITIKLFIHLNNLHIEIYNKLNKSNINNNDNISNI